MERGERRPSVDSNVRMATAAVVLAAQPLADKLESVACWVESTTHDIGTTLRNVPLPRRALYATLVSVGLNAIRASKANAEQPAPTSTGELQPESTRISMAQDNPTETPRPGASATPKTEGFKNRLKEVWCSSLIIPGAAAGTVFALAHKERISKGVKTLTNSIMKGRRDLRGQKIPEPSQVLNKPQYKIFHFWLGTQASKNFLYSLNF